MVDPSNVYIVSGSVAGPMLVFVLYTFCRFKHVRSHPAPLMFGKTLADTGFIFSTLLLSGVVDNGSKSATICSAYGPLITFFFMSSQFYFIGMCYDIWSSCTYPLRSVSYTETQIHICSWILSGIITLVFVVMNPSHFKHVIEGELCFLGINDRNIHDYVFLAPYIIGILSGLFSLLFVVIRLNAGLGEVFEHANVMVKDHIMFVSLYIILGIAWFILLLVTLDSGGLSFAVSFIIIGTAAIDCCSWLFLNRSHLKEKEQSMSSALRLEVIRSMCLGVTQALDHFKHNREYNTISDVTAAHFSPVSCIKMTKGSVAEKECILNQSIHRFLMSSQIDFIEYSPHVFRYLRLQCFNTTDILYAESFIQTNSSIESLSAKFSEGKSGAFFFMTPNSQFMVKTLKKSEAITFLRILPGYFEHRRKFNASFITAFYGLYAIKLYGTLIYFTIMKNIFIEAMDPHERYDIKGSWINRHTKHHIELGKLMKDEDLKKSILLPHNETKKVWEQLSHDTRLLNTLNIMDYSLLLGIYYIGISTQSAQRLSYQDGSRERYKAPELKEEMKKDILQINTMNEMKKDFTELDHKLSKVILKRRAFTAGNGITQLSSHPMSFQSRIIEGPGFYIMGLIDILQEYNFEKKIERFFKVFIQCVDGYGISCIEPNMYRKRFLAKMLQIGIGRGDKYPH